MDARGIPGCAYDSGFSALHVYFGPCALREGCERAVCLNADKVRDVATGQALFMNLAVNGVKTPTRGYDAFVSAVHTEGDLNQTVEAFGQSLDALREDNMLPQGS
jgi:glutamate-1-semialdehyde aminotransferase